MAQSAVVRACLSVVVVLAVTPTATAHGIVGDRMFIEPITTEDANVKNELVLPNYDFSGSTKGTLRTFGVSFEKSIYADRVSVVLESGRIVRAGGQDAGWDNLEAGLKWEAYISADHELALSPMFVVQLPTGSRNVTERETAIRPMLLFAKGLGDVHLDWLRPFAVQGDVGYERSVDGPDRTVQYDAVLMYSFPYLNDFVRFADAEYELEHSLRRGLSWGAVWGNNHPFVEVNAQSTTGSSGDTSTILRAGAAWMGKYVQLTMAADRRMETGASHWGATVMVDWFLDEIFPRLGSRADAGHAIEVSHPHGRPH